MISFVISWTLLFLDENNHVKETHDQIQTWSVETFQSYETYYVIFSLNMENVCDICWRGVLQAMYVQWCSQSSAITGALGGRGHVQSQGELWPRLWDSVTRTWAHINFAAEGDGEKEAKNRR